MRKKEKEIYKKIDSCGEKEERVACVGENRREVMKRRRESTDLRKRERKLKKTLPLD